MVSFLVDHAQTDSYILQFINHIIVSYWRTNIYNATESLFDDII